MSKLTSYLNLAFRFNVHLLKKPFTSAQSGRARFLENYQPDSLHPLPADARHALPSFSGCICCGLCETVCPLLKTSRRHLFNGPVDLPACLSRSLPHYPLLEEHLRTWDQCGECQKCEDICPAGVPLRRLAALCQTIISAMKEPG